MISSCFSLQRKAWILFLTLVFVASCKDPFDPDISFRETNFLVVEGYINIGTDVVTRIRLSRTVPLDETSTQPLRETGATILIEDDEDNTWSLTEQGNGFYVSAELSLPVDGKYRIRISTEDQGEYTSAFTSPIQTPAIDSVSWKRVPEGLDISVATHDPQQNTFYYQWDYEEVWELKSPFFSFYSYSSGIFFPREEAEIQAMRRCWRTAIPTDLIIRSTRLLESDAVSLKLFNIPPFNDRLGENYSVIVWQHALSMDAYNYLQIIIKNTNAMGGFFDPQPSQLAGNMVSKNSGEAVIGFIEAYTTSEERIYIENVDVPDWGFALACESQDIPVSNQAMLDAYFGASIYTPVTFRDGEHSIMIATWPTCADCRKREGNNNKPPFWDEVFP